MWKRHPRASTFGSGELSPVVLGCCDNGDQPEDGPENGLQSLERAKHRRVTAVTFVIEEQTVLKKGSGGGSAPTGMELTSFPFIGSTKSGKRAGMAERDSKFQ